MKRIAVIGAGYWGKNLIRNFSTLGVLAGVCDTNSSAAEQLASQYQVPVMTLSEIFLPDSKVDAVVIASPAALHFELAQKALEYKKDVYVEKPLALKVDQAEALCQLAIKNQKVLMVGHLLQYHPAFLKLKKMVDQGELGKLQYLYSNRLNLGKIRREEDILWSFAPHDISMILSLVGVMPEKVTATGGYYLHQSIADVTNTQLSFPDGQEAHIFVSWLHPFKEQKLIVVGDKGMAVFDDGEPWESKLKLYRHQIEWKLGMPMPSKAEAECVELEQCEPLGIECQHFVECIETRRQPRTDGEEGLNVLKVLNQAANSLLAQKAQQQCDDSSGSIHKTACVDQGAKIGADTKVWHYSHIFSDVTIGDKCVIGQNVMIGPAVRVGNSCKIQNNVSLYQGVILEDGVFCGPSCVFTNVNTPRAGIERKNEFLITTVQRGATIGANATIVCGVTLGEYCFIGAGAVVTKDVKPHALMVGNPAKQIGWVSHSGEVLRESLECPREKRKYQLSHTGDLAEIV